MTRAKVKVAVVVLVALAVAGVGVDWLSRQSSKPDVQSVPSPVDAAPADSAAAGDPDRFGQLASGVTVMLVGVSMNPSYSKPWWHADGSLLASPPYARAGGRFDNPLPGRVTREFAFAYDAQSVPGASEFVVTTAGSDGCITDLACDRAGRAMPNLIGAVSDLPDRPATVRFNLAGGPWKTLLRTPATGGGSLEQDRLTIGPAHFDDGGLAVDVTTADAGSTDVQTNLIAVDMSGAQHPADPFHVQRPSPSNAKIGLEIFYFGPVALQNVRTLKYQTRSFAQWVEFRNVSLHPGQKTAVTVITSDAPASTR